MWDSTMALNDVVFCPLNRQCEQCLDPDLEHAGMRSKLRLEEVKGGAALLLRDEMGGGVKGEDGGVVAVVVKKKKKGCGVGSV